MNVDHQKLIAVYIYIYIVCVTERKESTTGKGSLPFIPIPDTNMPFFLSMAVNGLMCLAVDTGAGYRLSADNTIFECDRKTHHFSASKPHRF